VLLDILMLVGSMEMFRTHSIVAFVKFLLFTLLLPPPSYAIIRTNEGIVLQLSGGDTLKVIIHEGDKLKYPSI